MSKFSLIPLILIFFSFNGFGQCPSVVPTAADTCLIGSGSVNLSANGSTEWFSWYDAVSGGNFLGSGSTFTTPNLISTTSFFVAAADTNRGITFDGSNDYVAIQNFSYNSSGLNAVTVEAWVKTTDGSDQIIASFDRSEYWRLGVNGDGAGPGQISWNIRTDAGIFDFGSVSTVNDGEWHHIAGVYDNGIASVYIDGVLDNQGTQGTTFGTGITRFGFLSAGSEATVFNGTNTPFNPFNGDMDEARIWNTARTQAQIQASMHSCLTGTESGLQVCISMEEGTGAGVATDKVASNDGVLINMDPNTDWIEVDHDYSCPTCESARATATVTILGSPPDLGPDLFSSCDLGTLILDPGSFTNYTWSTAETTPTINITNGGTYFVDVDNGAGCFGSDTIVVGEGALGSSPTTATANDTCVFGANSVELNASGSTGFYNWYDAASGGNYLGSGSTYTTPVIASTTTYFVAAKDENLGLNFDGNNDYVALNSSYSSTGITEVTVEAWIKTTKTTAQIIASYDRSDYWRFGVSSTGGGAGQVTWNLGTNAGILDMSSTGTVNDGNWHHVVGVYDNGNARIYIDGVQDGSASLGTSIGTGVTRFGFIATGSETASFNGTQTISRFQGEIDEFRIWSVAKSQAEIQASMNSCLNGQVDGLFAYYSFQDVSGTTLSDVFSGQDGTIFNMNNADWLGNDYNFDCENCESPRVAVDAIINSGSGIDLGADVVLSCVGQSASLDAGAGFSNYLWSTTESTQSISVANGGEITVLADDGAGCFAADTVLVRAPGDAAGTNLDFDGGNDYVAISNFSYASTTITELTVEAWIRTTSGGNQIIASYDRSEYWRLGVNGDGAGTGQISWNLSTNAGILDFGSTSTIHDGNWHHIVGVYNNGLASIYIDGELDNTANSGATIGTGVTRFGFISRGSESPTFNGATGPNDEFNGDIDEFRIWNVAKSEAEIRNLMCTSFEGSENGLEVYYVFNDGSGTTVTDVAGNSDGTMVNMNAADWVTSGAAVGNSSTFLYPASWAGQSMTLSSCSGDEVLLRNVTGTLDGMHVYSVSTDPTEQTGVLAFTAGNNYYGVFQTNSGTESYDLEYDYTNHSLLTASNENSLYLLDRTDNSDSPWVENVSVLDDVSNTLTATYSGRKEVIVDSKEFVWTGALTTDWNTGGNWLPTSVPPAGVDIRIPDVVNQPILDMDRSVRGLNIETLATADLNGNTLSISGNCLLDGDIISNNGTMNMNGTVTQDLMIANTLTIDNLTIDNANDVNTTSGSIDLIGTLTVSNGSFSTNDELTLISNAFGTARIAEITGTAVTGDITMERYIDAGETFWRYFGSAVQGATIAQFNDDFVTAGYPGSSFPAFGWISAYNYDETLGPGLGYLETTGATQVIQVGEGWQIWCGDTITGTQPFTWDLRGVANQGNINLPVTFTNTGTASEDGFCMVSNPYPSTIDWDDTDWIKTNMANATYIQNPDNQQYATYVAGASTNGGSKFIASQQSFWVQATGASPVLTATEGVKSSVDQAFFKTNTPLNPGMTITLQGVEEFDEVVLRHLDDAHDDFEFAYDANKWWGGWGEYPQISLINQEQKDLTVHSFNKGNEEWTIPLRAVVFANGNYNIEFDNLGDLNVPCLQLEDTYDGSIYNVVEGSAFTFEMSDTTYAPRFLLHLGKTYENNVVNASCHSEADGMIELDLDMNQDVDFTVVNDGQSWTGTKNGDPLQLENLNSGIYELTIAGLTNLCNQNVFNFVVNQPSELNVETIVSNEVNGADGSVLVTVNGGTPPYTYNWQNGSNSNLNSGLTAGEYTVQIVDANGCEISEQLIIENLLGLADQIDSEIEFVLNSIDQTILIMGLNANKQGNIVLLSASGQIVKDYGAASSAEGQLLKLPSLAKGVYFIRLTGYDAVFKFEY
jgi:Concanavalin A-like lectin/glucanases superfamily/Ig-like domain CHU_C associated/SprB repeat